MTTSSPYVDSGRTRQKARTHDALVQAARELLREGVAPTVEAAASRAGVSRATAFRYFANQDLLVATAHPETAVETLLPANAPDDVVERVRIVASTIMRIIVNDEMQYRMSLRVALEQHRDLPLRRGRRAGWFDEALAPLARTMTPKQRRTLTLRLAATVGIEPFVWLTDMAQVRPADAAKLLVENAVSVARDATT